MSPVDLGVCASYFLHLFLLEALVVLGVLPLLFLHTLPAPPVLLFSSITFDDTPLLLGRRGLDGVDSSIRERDA